MREDWVSGRLGDFFEVVTGGTPPKSNPEMFGDYMPLVKPPELNGREVSRATDNLSLAGAGSSRVLPTGSVLVSCIGNLGKLGLSAVPLATNQQINAIKPNEKLALPKYVFYWAMSPYFFESLRRKASGTTVPIVNKSKFSSIKISLPPLPEQERIVAILDEAFAGIATAVANTEKNLANARELFESYLNSVFSQHDEAWGERELGQLADFKNGLNFTKNSRGETVRIVGVKNFKSNYWVPNDCLEEVEVEGRLPKAYELKKNDIVIVRSNGNKQLIGRCLLADDVLEKTSHSGFTIRARLKTDELHPEFLMHYLRTSPIRERLVASGDGANISSLNQKGLATLPVRYPDTDKQLVIVRGIQEIDAESKQLASIYQGKLNALAELKQSLLQKAFSGELTTEPQDETETALA